MAQLIIYGKIGKSTTYEAAGANDFRESLQELFSDIVLNLQ
jgi:hypothetical protein